MAADPLPTHIGRYEVRSLLGAGAMGKVWLADDPLIKRKVAIKTLRLEMFQRDEDRGDYLARFRREAEISGILNDPGIVAIYDVGESEVGPFLAMEYVKGQTLDQCLKGDPPLGLFQKLRIIAGVAQALDHAHAAGIIHRDVKPGNVMISEAGRPKLMDFGIARQEDSTLTMTGTFMGTPSYVSPEQIRGTSVDSRSDLFSFAVMTFQLLTDVLPFNGNSINTILYKIVNEAPEALPPALSGILPGGWHAVFDRALAKSPQDRHPTCCAFVLDLVANCVETTEQERNVLRSILGSDADLAPGTAPRPAPRPAPKPAAGSSPVLPVLLAATVLGGVALAGGVYAARRGLLAIPGFPAATPPPPPAPAATTVRVESEPSGATVALDGRVLEGATPLEIPWVAGRRAVLTLRKGDLLAETPFGPGESPAGRVIRLAPQAPPLDPQAPAAAEGALKIGGAFPVRVRLGGRDLGEWGGGKALPLPAGTHQLELSAPQVFYREVRTVRIQSGEAATLALPNLVRVKITTSPETALILVDGLPTRIESLGEKAITLAAGSHVIGFEGKTRRETFNFQKDENRALPLE